MRRRCPTTHRCATRRSYGATGGGKTYAGQSDDPFFLDLRVFDLLYGGDASEVGEDTLAGYNVNQIALQLPKTALALNGDAVSDRQPGHRRLEHTDGATPERRRTRPQFVQVSRLGNPLVNEVVDPALPEGRVQLDPSGHDATLPRRWSPLSRPRDCPS